MRKRFILVLKKTGYVLTDERGGMQAVFPLLKDAVSYATQASAGEPAELVVMNEEGKASLELSL